MNTLQFEPWPTCTISTLFWKTLASKKLNEFRKGRAELVIKGFYIQNLHKTAQLFFSTESFETQISSVAELGSNFRTLEGKLILCDTIEEFKALDRQAEACKLAENNATCNNLLDVRHFLLFAYADVKRFKFYHQIAYPVQLFVKEQLSWSEIKDDALLDAKLEHPFAFKTLYDDQIVFVDNSIVKNVPGWPLRSILVNLSQKYSGKEFKVLCIRAQSSDTFVLIVKLPHANEISTVTGWERSSKDPTKIAPVRITDISALIDPIQLAKQAGELNLKLMKWRLVPDLDLDIISKNSCLLVGSGTLGCNILRILLVPCKL
jgi:ubiquitin-like modifier-activating enzyme ATG7